MLLRIYRTKACGTKLFMTVQRRLRAMGWLEYGLSYATVIYANGKNKLKGGITLKYIQGIAGAYFKNTDITYNINSATSFTFTNSSINYGRTDYNSLIDGQGLQDFINGQGWGGNVGVTYVRLREPYDENSVQTIDEKKNDYIYRIGLSVIDIGSIKFDKNSQAYHLGRPARRMQIGSNNVFIIMPTSIEH
jgi:hypothetical protein